MGHNLKYGLIVGLVSVGFNIILLLIDSDLLLSGYLGYVPVLVNIGILFYAGYELRKIYDYDLPFSHAFMSTFSIIAIGMAIATLYSMVLYNVIAPDLAAEFREVQKGIINQQALQMEEYGMDQETIDLFVIQQEAINPYSISVLSLGYLLALIGGAIGALIIAAIVKKKKPDFE